MARPRKPASASFDAITIEGGLITATMLASINARNAGEQKEEDYAVPKGLTLRDEIARYFRIGQALFRDLTASATPSPAATTAFAESFLRDVLGFTDAKRIGTRNIHDRLYAVTLEALNGRIAFVVVPPSDDLDRVSNSLPTDGRKRSASSALQDWLNANEETLWGLCCNGERIRLVRDNASFTRPAYIEANLRQIFENENFADFTTLWLLMHASRFGIIGTPVSDCALERWREAGSKEGVAARDRLRDGVEAALLALGNGFLAHPHNSMLRERLGKGELQLNDYFGQLLRLVYRLIFLLAAEDRNLLHPPFASASVRKLYVDGYSLACLRNFSVRRSAWDRHHDRWEGLLITFSGLSEGEPRLGLPALSGLFSTAVIPDLEIAHLSNRALMEAVYKLAWLKEPSGLVSVNWRDMETEELGSVYESLLELTPRLTDQGRSFIFAEGAETKGNTRKTTGSYYTPDSLVQALLDSALDSVLDRVESEADNPAEGLLTVTVIDPACGSGHFLLAAARRIASRVARVRAGGVASAEDYRHALRDVARSCIYGVDRNPMAVELTKVALWIETVEPGKPLGFLDANIRCGDALLGVFDLQSLREGIPDAAYVPLTGDDKDTAKYYAKRNKNEKSGQGELDLLSGKSHLPPSPPLAKITKILRSMPEDNVNEIAEKRQKYEASLNEPARCKWRLAADMYVAAFLIPKIGGEPIDQEAIIVPTTASVWQQLSEGYSHTALANKSQQSASDARAFHWSLEFPDIMERGGFDVVLGNPPWERIKLQEKEFFAARDQEIANAPNASARGRLIRSLATAPEGSVQRTLSDAFEMTKREAEAISEFVRVSAKDGGRFPLTGRGDVNTYALFAELFLSLKTARGQSGVVVPMGILTDDTLKIYFQHLVEKSQLVRAISFSEVRRWFFGTDDRKAFSLLCIGNTLSAPEFCFGIDNIVELSDREKKFTLSAAEIAAINPNTKTAPVFRSRADAKLTTKIYQHIPILVEEEKGAQGNPWGVNFSAMFHMSSDSGLFRTAAQLDEAGYIREGTDWVLQNHPSQNLETPQRYTPLYESKMIHQFDHRYGDNFSLNERAINSPLPHPDSKKLSDPNFEIDPWYWVPASEVDRLFDAKDWKKNFAIGCRSIARTTDERTLIATAIPRMGASGKFPLLLINASPEKSAAFLANLNSLIFDFIVRQKIGGTDIALHYIKQFPTLPPSTYSDSDLSFIVPRVLELTYTSHAMAPFARDLGCNTPPFRWNDERRALLRAELDAWYAKAYGLTRDELRYVLDPADAMRPDYPSETFRVLKEREIKEYGEYRTRRLILEAWDRMIVGTDQGAVVIDPTTLPDDAWVRPSDGSASTLVQLAAIIKALPQPTPISQVRLVALYALEPQYLTNRLSGTDRNTWLRLVGQAARPHTGATVTAFAPRINAGWRDAVVQLRGMGAIIEDVNAQTWMQGAPVNQFDTETWPDGRARFVLKMLKTISINEATTGLPAEDQAWIANAA